MKISGHINVDDTGARHNGANGYCTHIGNDLFAWFKSTETKSRINFLKRHWKALNVEKMLLEKSKQLYQDVYILEEYNPEKTREKWKKVLVICSPGTDYYQKALLKSENDRICFRGRSRPR